MKKFKSCGVLLFCETPELMFLLMKHRDRLDLPKGHIKKGETELECAMREFEEETGLDPADVRLDPEFRFELTYFPRYKKLGGKRVEKKLVIFLGWLTGKSAKRGRIMTLQVTEHIGFEWNRWDPPHDIQPETVNPLLEAVQEHFDSLEQS